MTIALAHGGATMQQTTERSAGLLVGTVDGVVRFERAPGGGWREASRALAGLHISAFAEPAPNIILAGAFQGGIHASRDGGATWERADKGVDESDVYSLACVATASGVRVYAGTEPVALFSSDDLGATWNRHTSVSDVPGTERWTFPAPPHVAHAKHITFHPDDPSHVYVSVEQGGLLESWDSGATFNVVEGMDDDVHRVVVHPAETARMFVTGGDGIYASEDAGATWEQRTTSQDDAIGGYSDQLVFVPSQPETMFVAAAHRNPATWFETHDARARVSRSDDGGRTWHQVGGGLPDGLSGNIEAMVLEESPQGVSLFIATTAGEVFASDDCGESWAPVAEDLGAISKGGHYHLLQPA